MEEIALQHVQAEDAGDVDATLATLQDDAVYELYPVGLRMSGKECIRRYYEYFFAHVRHRCVAYTTHASWSGPTGLCLEFTITWRYDDGTLRDFRNLTILPYGSTGLLGERLYADFEFYRLIFGPLLAEMQPIAQ